MPKQAKNEPSPEQVTADEKLMDAVEALARLEQARCALGAERAFPGISYAQLPRNMLAIADVANRTQAALSWGIAGYDKDVQLAILQRTVERRSELLADGSTALECLLVEEVLTCELAAAHADSFVNENRGISINQGEYLLHRQAGAHRRLLSAVRTLAQVRRHMVPAMQVNIGQNQMNLVGPSPRGRRQRDGELFDEA